jgi:predicted DNA-binding transcriptional regulator YafY
MSTSDRAERLLNVLFALMASARPMPKSALREVIDAYRESPSEEAFERMFERDKDELRGMGIPIETIEGTDGQGGIEGYRILRDAYALPEVSFSGDELAVLGLAAKVWEQASLGASAQRALRKLESMGDGSVIEGPVGVEVRIATSDASFPLIMEAIRQRRAVQFEYRKPAERDTRERSVQPWGVVSRKGHWYLVGYDVDRSGPRVFRLSRITGIPSITGPAGAYEIPSDVDVASMIRASNPDDVQLAQVRIDPGAAVSLRRRAIEMVEDIASVPFSDVDVFATEIVQYADSVVVLSPESLRLAVIERLTQLAGLAS